MKYVSLVVLLIVMMSVPAYAKDKGRGPSTDTTRERVTDELVDAVADELLGEDSTAQTTTTTHTGRTPPGVSNKGSLPPGLQKKGTVPPGWSKGNKKGWDGGTTTTTTTKKKSSLLRRMVRSIFRGGKEGDASQE